MKREHQTAPPPMVAGNPGERRVGSSRIRQALPDPPVLGSLVFGHKYPQRPPRETAKRFRPAGTGYQSRSAATADPIQQLGQPPAHPLPGA
jgi:hypothetical protein